ncbi:hypothetical protein [Novosphingobium sp. BW1]|uniref:hypothetical protein n=1 Tax=Novosphingobium sp. BW1 TaxID=2592621 RepID=UPI0011DEB994|nr:hypothetical protein [Novosphingobium sp. BW1]TYC85321.1 hypothetical protein FMM79_17480 [Novosphingobium sp. BW1]
MQIPSDYWLTGETFEDVLDLEAAVRLAASTTDMVARPDVIDIHDAWVKLQPRLPQATWLQLEPSIARMLDAFNDRNTGAMKREQEDIAARLAELRRVAA